MFSLLAVAMAFVMGLITPVQALEFSEAEKHLTNTSAETLENELNDKTIGNYTGNTTLYISDLMIANGDTAEEAKKVLHDKGYMVYDCDLNEGTDNKKKFGGYLVESNREVPKKYVYLGYKITTDRTKAITDLNLMDQDGGYEVFDYLQLAEQYMPGVDSMVDGMRESCNKLRIKLENGNYASKVAKKYLDLFYVPEKMNGTTGERLGDYLLARERTQEEYKKLILLLNSLVLNIVNTYLAIGLIDTTLQTQQAKGGMNADGTVTARYTSYTGVTGCTEFIKDDNWLVTATGKMAENKNFADVNKTEDLRYFVDLTEKYGLQLATFKRVMKDGNLTNTAKNYLESVKIETGGGKISAALGLGKADCTAYDLLTRGSDKMLLLFFVYVAKYSQVGVFHDAVEICASDYQHRLPNGFSVDKKYDIPWAKTVVEYIQNEQQHPTTKTDRAGYNGQIDSLIKFIKFYADQYNTAMKEYKENSDILTLTKEMTDDEADKRIGEAVGGDSDDGTLPVAYHVAVRNAFAQYKISDKQSLLDYLISAVDGKKEGDESVRAALFPVVQGLGEAGLYSISSCNITGFLTNSLMSENEIGGLELELPMFRMDLAEGYETDDFNVWVGTQKDLTESDETMAVTSRDVYEDLLTANADKAFSSEIPMKKKLETTLIKLGVAGASMLAGAIIFAATSTLIWKITGAIIVGVKAVATMGFCGGAIAATICSLLATAAIIGVVITILAAAVIGILYIVELWKEFYAPVIYTTIPATMIDATRDEKGDFSDIAKYYVVRDPNGKAADIKGFVSRKWLALYYTKDPTAGSPMILGKNNSFFEYTVGTDTPPYDECMPLSKFLRRKSFNLNNNCYFDRVKSTEMNEDGTYPTVSGKYLFFYTEDSVAKKNNGFDTGKYISDIMIAHSDTTKGTEWYLENMEGYELLGTNLSPDCEYNTYIAFRTTNEPDKAIRDIRAAYNTAAPQIIYGDVIYNNVLKSDKNMMTCPAITCNTKDKDRVETPFSYNLYVAKKSIENGERADAVGDPILTSSLSCITDLSMLKEGYDLVSYFAGVPIDFDSFDHEGHESFGSHFYICYSSVEPKEDSKDAENKDGTNGGGTANTSDNTKPAEEKKEPEQEYLAGFGFFSGSEDWNGDGSKPGQTMQAYATESYGAKLIPTNLTPSLYYNKEDRTYLGYVTTKNPKKALTDIAVFTGEPKSYLLPQTVTVGSTSYCACDVFTQGDYHYYGSGGDYRQRWIRPSHAYFTTMPTEYNGLYWYYPYDFYTYLVPRALYGCGPCTDGKPIKIEDVLFSTSSASAPVNNSNSLHANEHLYRLSANSDPVSLNFVRDIGTNWRSVHSLDHYYYDDYDANGNLLSSFDLGLGYDDPKDDKSGTGHLYIYYKSADKIRRRGNYVSGIKLSGDVVADNSYNTAVITALAGTEDIVNIDNPITLTDKSYDFGKNREMFIYTGSNSALVASKEMVQGAIKKYDDGCFFVSVSYSDLESNSVRSVRVMKKEREDKELPSTLKLPLYNSKSIVPFAQTSTCVIDREVTTDPNANIADLPYAGYAMYRSISGYTTNRVEVRFVNTANSTRRFKSSSVDPVTGVAAEYYAAMGDTTDPFVFKTIDGRIGATICLQSYTDAEKRQNTDKYIEDIVVADATTFDGNMELAAAKLGAMGYPYMVDFDISESARTDGTGTVSALGIRRTDNPENAIKDIRISSVDLGINYDANGIRYQRVNEKPVKLSGADKDGVYIYITYGAEYDSVLWSDILKNKTPLDEVDWFSLDYAEATRIDTTFQTTMKSYFAAHPGLSSSVDAYLAEAKKTKTVNYELKSDWEEKTALTNIGFAPTANSPEQNARSANNLPTKDIYWAGCSAFKDDKFIVPVTESTAKLSARTFDGDDTLVGLRFTNNGNEQFTPFGKENEAGLSASVFSNRNFWIIVIISAVFLSALAAVYIVYRKKKTVQNT